MTWPLRSCSTVYVHRVMAGETEGQKLMSGTSAKEQIKAQLQVKLIQCLWVETPQVLPQNTESECVGRQASSPSLQCTGGWEGVQVSG